ncbi:aldehyde dehydrogenase family protein [Pseudomonas typographi]|uniref:Aldehyde dehydrogenase family protein n=1 Tax=Pseudomonas typographi TaxID=2715964 RepID=A0ABR7YY15_9PSED|nr:aldehyde dehydrogenase family protein [Pseudomonas typographi]MBD1550433.1 aldehyde dehydrogenase family protein [Pseudomonas typographi]MBD1587890.1 aldehyde dehydrogenase family protein [Pseudomonas typographi]MBD1598098.1 aldehyde dehydrogenase family protein [Pseudomonas typographi]
MSNLHPQLSQTAAQFIQREHRLLIDGRWVAPSAGKQFDVEDPGTGRLIARVAEGQAADIDLAVAAARRAFEAGDWARCKPADRTRLLLRLADLIEQHGDELAELEVMDNGKPLAFARRGITGTAEMVRYMAGWVTKLTGEAVPLSMPGTWHAYTVREPVGVVGQIIPWNFPLSMAIWKLAPALAAGCTVVLKPAEQTPLNALRLGELIMEAGFPAGVVNIVTGFGGDAGAALAAHPGVDKVAFTGSTATGKRIVQAALGNLKKVTLELGGKSPVFIFPDADLAAAIPGAANAIFFNSGQVCSAGSRLYVHRKVYDQVVADIAAYGDRLQLGHGMEAGNDLGPLISKVQMERVQRYIEAGREGGATVVSSQRPAIEGGYFVPPTVLADTDARLSVVREEIFGPVLCAMPFDDDDLASVAALANDTEYGLFAGIWTQDIGKAHKLAKRIRAGSVSVNAHMVNDPALPFGGFKQSGWGRERGREALELYSELKSVAINLGQD